MSARAPLCWLHCCVGRSGIVLCCVLLYCIVLCAIVLLFVCLRLPRELYAESPVLQLTIDCVEAFAFDYSRFAYCILRFRLLFVYTLNSRVFRVCTFAHLHICTFAQISYRFHTVGLFPAFELLPFV